MFSAIKNTPGLLYLSFSAEAIYSAENQNIISPLSTIFLPWLAMDITDYKVVQFTVE
tara:strand:+ start:1998 stop:2168 length:171 start_codon:yes stop_codon:yes gene_type:complete